VEIAPKVRWRKIPRGIFSVLAGSVFGLRMTSPEMAFLLHIDRYLKIAIFNVILGGNGFALFTRLESLIQDTLASGNSRITAAQNSSSARDVR